MALAACTHHHLSSVLPDRQLSPYELNMLYTMQADLIEGPPLGRRWEARVKSRHFGKSWALWGVVLEAYIERDRRGPRWQAVKRLFRRHKKGK